MRLVMAALAGVALAAGVASSGLAQQTAPTSEAQLVWLTTADSEAAAAWPARANAAHIGGQALVACKIKLDGSLSGCRILGENPAGKAFGAAALSLMRFYRAKPGTFDHQPIPDLTLLLMQWNYAEVGLPPAPFLLGDDAALISGEPIDPGSGAKAVQTCLAQASCQSHRFTWTAGPNGEAIMQAIVKHGAVRGVDLISCGVDQSRRLTGCTASSAKAQAVIDAVGDRFVTPETTDDGTPIGNGPVVIHVAWAPQHAAALALTAP